MSGFGQLREVATGSFAQLRHKPVSSAPWLIDLRNKLKVSLDAEMELTVQVAVMMAAKCNRTQIIHTLGCTDTDVKMAQQRLAGVAEQWKD